GVTHLTLAAADVLERLRHNELGRRVDALQQLLDVVANVVVLVEAVADEPGLTDAAVAFQRLASMRPVEGVAEAVDDRLDAALVLELAEGGDGGLATVAVAEIAVRDV